MPKKIIRNRINGLEKAKKKKKEKTRNISKVKIVTELYSVQERSKRMNILFPEELFSLFCYSLNLNFPSVPWSSFNYCTEFLATAKIYTIVSPIRIRISHFLYSISSFYLSSTQIYSVFNTWCLTIGIILGV